MDVADASTDVGDANMTAAGQARSPAPADSVYHEVGYWAMVLFCCTEAALFAYLLSSYFYLGVSNTSWPPAGTLVPSLSKPLLMTVFLVSSSVVLVIAERARGRGRTTSYRIGVLGTIVLGLRFLTLMVLEY